MKKINILTIILFLIVLTLPSVCIFADDKMQNKQDIPEKNTPPEQPIVKDLGDGRLQVGNIIIDGNKKEVIVPGRINMIDGPIEFIACTKGGFKAYESVLEMETDAITFNLSMILLGLDPKKGKAAAYHFDPNQPQGDTVEISIQWDTEDDKKTIMAQEIIHDMSTGKTFPADHWVYTGSVFLEDGRYLAELDGVLIGFVHDPASVIESHFSEKFPAYGTYVVNKNHLLKVGMKVQMFIKPFEVAKNN